MLDSGDQYCNSFVLRLSDESASVRLTAITVLTQLVLKDVMKVKGQVSEVAVLLLDPEPHIASLALNFFNELSAKVAVSLQLCHLSLSCIMPPKMRCTNYNSANF